MTKTSSDRVRDYSDLGVVKAKGNPAVVKALGSPHLRMSGHWMMPNRVEPRKVTFRP